MEVDLQVVLGLEQPRELLSQLCVCLRFVGEEPDTGHGGSDLVLEEESERSDQKKSGMWKGCEENSDRIPTHEAWLPTPTPITSCPAHSYPSHRGPGDPKENRLAGLLGRKDTSPPQRRSLSRRLLVLHPACLPSYSGTE